MRLFIADDEPLARQRLRRLLSDSRHEVVGEAGNGEAALAAIRQLQPDVALLDIRMPLLDGLAVAAALIEDPYPPAVIFVTAYSAHMLEAFQVQARNYLLKPVRRQDLLRVLETVSRLDRVQLDTARRDLLAKAEVPVLICGDHGRQVRVPVDEILYCRSQDRSVLVCRPGGLLDCELSLREIESRLPQLMRIHRQVLVHPARVESLSRQSEGEGWQLQLRGLAEPLEVSRRLLAEVRRRLAGDSDEAEKLPPVR